MMRFAVLAVFGTVVAAQTGGPQHPAVTAIRHWSTAESTRIAVELSAEFHYRTERLHNPERVYFDIPEVVPRLGPKRFYSEDVDDAALKRIRVAETKPGVTRIVLELGPSVVVSTSQLSNPNRLIVELRKPSERPSPATATAGAVPDAVPSTPPTSAPAAVPAGSAPRAAGPPSRLPKPEASKTAPLAVKEPPAVKAETSEKVTVEPKGEPAGKPVSTPKPAGGPPPGKAVSARKPAAEPRVDRVVSVPKAVVDPRLDRVVSPPKPAGEPPAERVAPATKPAGEPPADRVVPAPKPAGEPPVDRAVSKPAGEPPAVTAAPAPQASGNKPAGDKAAGEDSVADKSAPVEKPAPSVPEGEKRAAEASAAAGKAAPETVVESGKAARHTAQGETSLVRALGLKINRVVLDPGHGGHDAGTEGPKGLQEKELVLDVAKRLGKLIEDRMQAEVIYTRANDTFIPLEGRTALANEKKADLFLSIHANYAPTAPKVAGVETYYLNFTESKDALDVAARENAASQKSIFELRDLLQKITKHDKAEESREFAGRVQAALYAFSARNFPSARNRGVRKAPFVVLIGANMPSVLAEIGFLSNPKEEALLKKPDYRQRLAESLFRGVQRYADGLSHFQVAQNK